MSRNALVLIFAGVVIAGLASWYALSTNETLRGLMVAARLPAHREALLASCPVVPETGFDKSAKPAIAVTRWGDAGARILIIHGGVQGNLGGGVATFAKQKPLIDRGWQLLLPDRPGFGQSPSRGPDDMEADAAWIAGLLDDVNLVGHSFGGGEALLAAAQRPEDVRALILIEPALHALLPRSDVLARDAAARADFLRLGEAMLAAGSPAEYGLVFARSLGAGTDAAASLERDPGKAPALGCGLLRARAAARETLRSAAEAVAKARIPVLVITGGWSPTFDAVGELAAELTGGKHVIVPSPNHFPQQMNPDAFNDVVSTFLSTAANGRAVQ